MRPPVGAGAVAIVLLLTAGCGGAATNGESAKSARQIIADAKSSIAGVKSVHEIATGLPGSVSGIDERIALGKGLTARLRLKGGGSVQLIEIGDTTYSLPNAAFWHGRGRLSMIEIAPNAAIPVIRGRWFEASANDGYQPIRFSFLSSSVAFFSGANKPLRKGKAATINGQRAVEVIGKAGTLWVAADGTPYPLAFQHKSTRITFSGWNQTVALRAPRKPPVFNADAAISGLVTSSALQTLIKKAQTASPKEKAFLLKAIAALERQGKHK